MGRQSLYNEAQWLWVADRYREGYAAEELAEFLDVLPGAVYRYMREMGVKRGKWKKPPLADRAKEFNSLMEE